MVLHVLVVHRFVAEEAVIQLVDDGEGGFSDGVFFGESSFEGEPGDRSGLRESVVDNNPVAVSGVFLA